ncbi:hypothetical protein [Paenibacillus abyssi]|uniref:CBM-cenC domain-containing protein n=1 Tax=Paenibacillus abyssi TaxID=1340531 RepID=A0A917LEN7_9BACL|nr:hypothetical protein [Paenibacillus abyssi]GGG17179.1 hypothetical protein GCM10010916_37540 [Paenibacillus abyssi]
MKWKRLTAILLSAALAVPALFPAAQTARAENVTYEPIAVPNGGFEQSADSYLGWTANPAMPSDGLEVSVRQERVASGLNSLYMADHSTSKSLEVASELIPITAGGTYRVTTSVYVESKSVRVYLRYKKAGSSADLSSSSNSILANKVGVWDNVTLEGIAPADAEFAQITFYYGAAGTDTRAYIDDVKLEQKVDTSTPLEVPYDPPVMIGDAVSYALSQSAAYGIGPDGRWEHYLTTVGSPVSFHVVDASTGALKFTQPISGSADTIWAIAKGSDGNMYFSSNGTLYRYLVAEQRIEALGVNPSNKQVFDLKASRDGKIYGSTYSNTNLGRVFEYDIASNTFLDLGVMKAGQQYARGLGVTDDYVYVGIGTSAHLMRYNRQTKEITEIVIPAKSGTNRTISEVDIYGGKLFAYSGNELYVMDEATGAHVTTLEFQTKIAPPSPDNPNLIYYKLRGDLYVYNIADNTATRIDGIPELPDDTAVKAHAWITPDSGPLAGRQVLAGMAAFGESFLYDPQSKQYAEHSAQVPASATAANVMETDGRYLYIGGYQRGMSIYDLERGEFIYNNKEFHQPEGIGFLGEAAYFGTYSGAVMYRLDMSKPLNYNELGEGNPGMVLDIEDNQDRPFTMTSGDGKLFIGTFPSYGQLGGALTILEETVNPADNSIQVQSETFRNIVPNQSLFGLAYHDGKIYGGTSIWGGLGVNPSEPEAKLFVFDTQTRQVTNVFTPRIPGVSGEVKLIGELSVGPDGLIWGILDGFVSQSAGYDAALFAMDPETLTIVKSKVITSSPFNTSKYRPYYIRWGDDGLIYSTIGRKLMAIDPKDLRSKQVIPGTVNLMTQSPDGSLFYAQGSKLHKVPVQLESAALTIGAGSVEVGSSTSASVSVMQKNGKQALLGGAAITYTSSDSGIVSVNGDQLTGVAPGTASITAAVTLDGRTLNAGPVLIEVTMPVPEVDENTIRIPAAIEEQPLDAELLQNILDTYKTVRIVAERTVVLPLAALENAKGNASVQIQTGQAEWTLKPGRLPLKQWSAALGESASSYHLRMNVTEQSAELMPKPSEGDMELLSPLYAFSMTLVNDKGETLLTPKPVKSYVERIIRLTEPPSSDAAVIMLEPESEKIHAVPHRIKGTEASFWNSGNGTYAVILKERSAKGKKDRRK